MDAIKEFPPDFELDSLIEKLIFMEKVEKGLLQLEQDKTISHGKVKELVTSEEQKETEKNYSYQGLNRSNSFPCLEG